MHYNRYVVTKISNHEKPIETSTSMDYMITLCVISNFEYTTKMRQSDKERSIISTNCHMIISIWK